MECFLLKIACYNYRLQRDEQEISVIIKLVCFDTQPSFQKSSEDKEAQAYRVCFAFSGKDIKSKQETTSSSSKLAQNLTHSLFMQQLQPLVMGIAK